MSKLFIVILCVILSYCCAQYSPKAGDCPPAAQYDVCRSNCYADEQCRGNLKCCSTSCGGTVCLRPVTMRTDQNRLGNLMPILIDINV